MSFICATVQHRNTAKLQGLQIQIQIQIQIQLQALWCCEEWRGPGVVAGRPELAGVMWVAGDGEILSRKAQPRSVTGVRHESSAPQCDGGEA